MAENIDKTGERRNLKPLNRGDSGYISPVTPGSEHSTPSRTQFMLGSGSQNGASSGSVNGTPGRSSTAPAGETVNANGNNAASLNLDAARRPTLARPSSTPVQDVERTPGDFAMLQRAFQCRECHAHLLWNCPDHHYCIQIKAMWDHWYQSSCTYRKCGTCRLLVRLLEMHSDQCKEPEGACLVQGCQTMRKRTSNYANSLMPSKEESSQTDSTDPASLRRHGRLRRTSSVDSSLVYSQFGQFASGFNELPVDSPEMQRISDMAEQIVSRLDQEEPLLPHYSDLQDDHSEFYSSYNPLPQLQSLYSIAEDHTPTSGFGDAYFQSFPSGSFGSFGQGPISGEADGIINLGTDSTGGSPSMGGNAASTVNNNSSCPEATSNQGASNNHGGHNSSMGGGNNSLGGEEHDTASYPSQVIKFQLRTDILTVGPDSHYYQSRDYNAADVSASGGFGTVHFCTDLTTKQMFAMKHNSSDNPMQINSMHTEASLLSRLGEHDHVIQMYGAVVDEQQCAFQPPKVYKMMMELAEHGNLSNLLVDQQNDPAPLDPDQSLYYFRQLLLGVKFLHDNGVLHLDIKCLNLLIFNEGKTLKLCDFGTAMSIDSLASSSRTHCCMTPLFAAPEICREELPRFSADIWSCMCVLVEMLTAQSPWHKIRDDGCNQYSIMFAVGSYKDEVMETDLIPNVETLSPELVELMRLVFLSDHKQRSTALELLSHPLIVNAGDYESEFDGYGDEYDKEMDEDEMSKRSSENEGCGDDIQPSLPLSHSSDSSGKRLSKDSGTGSDIEQDSLRGYSRKSSHGRNSDSGLDTPSQDRSILCSPCPEESDRDLSEANREIASPNVLHQRTTHGFLSLSPHGLDSYSLATPPTSLPLQLHPFNSGTSHFAPSSPSVACPSYHGHTHSTCSSCDSRLIMHQCSCPSAKLAFSPVSGAVGGGVAGRLKHSNSAPSIGTNYHRRHSLQPLYSLNSDGQILFSMESSRKTMRRSSSVYASSGPDIDSPEGRKKFVGMDSPTRKEVASQTRDPEEESEEERNSQKSDDEFSQPISIRLSVLDADKVASLTSSQSVSTSTAACGTGDITGRVSHDTGALSSTESDQNLPKSGKCDSISSKHSSLEDDDTVERDNGRRNVSSGMAGRATTYETIC